MVRLVVSKLGALRNPETTGDISQNVSITISAGTARAFLDGYGNPNELRRRMTS
jgi:hypothetical protein